MGKGAKGRELENSGNAQANSKQLYGESQGDFNFLDPTLTKEATNPEGYTPQQLAYMETMGQQSLGGGEAATTGQAGLTAARTRNAGAFQGAVGTADRNTQKTASQNALQVAKSQADLQQQQRQQALQSLQSLYSTNLTGSEGETSLSNSALHDENTAPNFWQQYALGAQAAAGKAASAGGA
jgi:hypothetical protein